MSRAAIVCGFVGLLVGASIGGIYIRAYQRAYPGDAAGLVFTNSSGRVGLITKGGGDLVCRLAGESTKSKHINTPFRTL